MPLQSLGQRLGYVCAVGEQSESDQCTSTAQKWLWSENIHDTPKAHKRCHTLSLPPRRTRSIVLGLIAAHIDMKHIVKNMYCCSHAMSSIISVEPQPRDVHVPWPVS